MSTVETKEMLFALNSAESGYNVQCPRCSVSVRFGLAPANGASKRERHGCYRCRSRFAARYSTSCAIDEAGQSEHGFPKRMRVRVDITWMGESATPATSPAPSSHTQAETAMTSSQLEMLANALESARLGYHDEIERAKLEVKAEVERAREVIAPTVIEIHIVDRPAITVNAQERHMAYPDALDAVMATGKCLLVGPPGSGKSTLARQIADDLEFAFTFLACTEGLSEAHILGRMSATGDYVPSAFVQGFEGSGPYAKAKGVVHLWDEVDAMDANTALVINEALSNGHISIPNRAKSPFATMRKNFLQFAAANTWGTGAQVEHTGRNALDAAFLDRFTMTAVWVDYDLDRERAVAASAGLEDFAEALWKIRANAREHKVRRPVSTRAFINGAKLRLAAPERWSSPRLLERFFAGWPTSERAKVIEGVTLGHVQPGSAQ